MELSQRSFFEWIRLSWTYSSLEIHNHISFFTDNLNLKKLNLLKNDFESFLGFERSRFLKRFSIEDINKAILKFNSDKEEKIVYENLLSDEKLDLIEKLLCPNEFYACYRFLDTLIAEIKDQQGSSIHDFKTQTEGINDKDFSSDNPLTQIEQKESSESDVKLIIEDYIEQFWENGTLSDSDYHKTLDIFEAFLTGKTFIISSPVRFKKRRKKAFASECGNVYQAVNGSKPISLDFLIFLKQNFNAYKDEAIDENRFQKSNIYKYLTT